MVKNNKKKHMLFDISLIYIFVIYRMLNMFPNISVLYSINKYILFVSILVLVFVLRRCITIAYNLSNIIILLNILYILCSATVYYFICSHIPFGKSIEYFFREMLCILLPMILYFPFQRLDYYLENRFYIIFTVGILLSFVFGLVTVFYFGSSIFSQSYDVFGGMGRPGRFYSFYGPIVGGYFYVMLFNVVLYKKIKIGNKVSFVIYVLSVIGAILTFQRAAVYGIVFSMVVYMVLNRSNIKINNIIFVCLAVFTLFILLIFYTKIINRYFRYDLLLKLFQSFISEGSLKNGLADRIDQWQFNFLNIFTFVFGEGIGKYSSNNLDAQFTQSDAAYVRIFNEMGVLGMGLFITWWILVAYQQLKKDKFIFVVIVWTLLAFGVNRVLWYTPVGFWVYSVIGLGGNKTINERIEKTLCQ